MHHVSFCQTMRLMVNHTFRRRCFVRVYNVFFFEPESVVDLVLSGFFETAVLLVRHFIAGECKTWSLRGWIYDLTFAVFHHAVSQHMFHADLSCVSANGTRQDRTQPTCAM